MLFACLFVCIQVNVTESVCSQSVNIYFHAISHIFLTFLFGKWKSFRRKKNTTTSPTIPLKFLHARIFSCFTLPHHNHHFKSLTRVVENFTHFSCRCVFPLTLRPVLFLFLFLFSFMVDTVRCVITRALPTTTK